MNIYFAAVPEQVFDTISLAQEELPYAYRDTLIADFGDYELWLYNEEGCLDQVFLHVRCKTPSALENPDIYDRPRLIMRDGVVYVLRAAEIFTILGEKLQVTLNDYIAKRHSYSGGALFWYAFC